MTEVAFPLLGAALVLLVVLPLCALFSKLVLLMLERQEWGGPLHGSLLRYVVLLASSGVPLGWFFSAGIHQFEEGESVLSCLFEHNSPLLTGEPVLFALVLASGVLLAFLLGLRRLGWVQPSASPGAHALSQRVTSLGEGRPAWSFYQGRVTITEQEGFVLGVRGFFRPQVFLGRAFGESLCDAQLVGALEHEFEHLRSLDPLRYLLLRLALDVNPIGRFLLEPHAARWKVAQEAHCDRAAVLQGAPPLALAEAILRAARPPVREAVALSCGETAALRLRIELLLAFAEQSPRRCSCDTRSSLPWVLAVVGFVMVLPHHAGTGALHMVHRSAEQALALFLN